jgi:hypothetical protein
MMPSVHPPCRSWRYPEAALGMTPGKEKPRFRRAQVSWLLDDRFHESCHKRGIHLGFRTPI